METRRGRPWGVPFLRPFFPTGRARARPSRREKLGEGREMSFFVLSILLTFFEVCPRYNGRYSEGGRG